jgi:hypothetical protein
MTNQSSTGLINPRLLGMLGMAGAPFLFIEGLTRGLHATGSSPLGGFLEMFYLGGWMSSIIGLGMLQATGRGKGGRTILRLQILGLSLAAIFSLFNIVLPNLSPESVLFLVTDLAWPLSHTFMLVVGIAVLVTKGLSGWTRFAPLACGLAVPLLFAVGMLGGEQAIWFFFGPYTWVVFTLLGYAVRTGK